MKSLEKATADYEKAKEKMEASKARYEADLKRFKAAENAKTFAESEFEQYRVIQDRLYQSDFDRLVASTEEKND